jgi:hypothetical protein
VLTGVAISPNRQPIPVGVAQRVSAQFRRGPTPALPRLPQRGGLPPDLLRKLPRPAPTPGPRTPAPPRNPTSSTPTDLIGSQAEHQPSPSAARAAAGHLRWSSHCRCFPRGYYRNPFQLQLSHPTTATVLSHEVGSTVVISNVNCPKAAPLTCPAAPDPFESTPRFRPGGDGTPRRYSRHPSPPP